MKHINDRYSIYANHEEEIRQLSNKLDYPVDDIVSAIQEVGMNEEDIEEYIRDRYDRSL
jgi:cupin superfamily acireductone dioxygenase involved in methionine salvage